MKRCRKWIYRLLIAMAFLVGVTVVLYIAVLPGYVHSRLISGLREVGISDSAFDIGNVAPNGLKLTNLALGSPTWLSANEIAASYTLASIWNGRVTKIEARNAVWRIIINQGTIDFGPKLKRSESVNMDIPFELLDVHDSTLIIEDNGQVMRLPFEASFSRTSSGQYKLNARIHSLDEFELGGVTIAGAYGELHLHIDWLGSETRLFALDDNVVRIDSVAFPSSDGVLRTSSITAGIQRSTNEPLLKITSGDDGSHIAFRGQIITKNAVSLRGRTTEASVDRLELSAVIDKHFSMLGKITARTEIAIANGAFRSSAAQLSLGNVSGTIPFSVGATSEQTGDFSIGSIAWRDAALPAMAGTVGVSNWHAEAQTVWPIMENALLSANAAFDFSEEQPLGELTATIPPFEMTDPSLLAKLLPQLEDVQIGGTYSLDASLRFAAGREIEPFIIMTAQNASLQKSAWAASIDSASGTITIDDFSPLSTSADQRIEVAKARIGEMDITNGLFTFTLETPESIHIEQAVWSMGEMGRFRAQPFSFNPAQPHIQTQLVCDDVGLSEWLPRLSSGRVIGEGKLSGAVALVVQPYRPNIITLEGGTLHSQNETGWIQTADAQMLSDLLEQNHRDFAGDAPLAQAKDKIVAALQDFAYSDLRVDFVPKENDLLCRMHTRGRGRIGPHPQEFGGLTINILQFDKALNVALGFKSALDSME